MGVDTTSVMLMIMMTSCVPPPEPVMMMMMCGTLTDSEYSPCKSLFGYSERWFCFSLHRITLRRFTLFNTRKRIQARRVEVYYVTLSLTRGPPQFDNHTTIKNKVNSSM